MTKSGQYQGSSSHQSYSRATGHVHQSKGPHKGKKTAGKRRLNYGGAGAGSRGGEHSFGNRTAKENAFKAGYRKAAPRPFMMDGEVVPKLDQK